MKVVQKALMAFTMFLLVAVAPVMAGNNDCLLYTSDAADERSSVDLGGRRIIKKNIIVPMRLTE